MDEKKPSPWLNFLDKVLPWRMCTDCRWWNSSGYCDCQVPAWAEDVLDENSALMKCDPAIGDQCSCYVSSKSGVKERHEARIRGERVWGVLKVPLSPADLEFLKKHREGG